MGQIKFIVPRSENGQTRLDERALETIYLIGIENIPWPCKLSREDDCLILERNTGESGRAMLSLPVDGHGEIVVATATLPERDEPYNLLLELARGTINRLMSQLFLWSEGGLEIAEGLQTDCESLVDELAELVFEKDAYSQAFADRCYRLIDTAIDNTLRLAKLFSDFVTKLRIQHDGCIKTAFGMMMSSDDQKLDDSLPDWANSVCISLHETDQDADTQEFGWSTLQNSLVEYTSKTKLICCGPMIDFSQKTTPNWLNTNDPFETQRKTAANFARSFAKTFAKQTKLVYVASGLNGITQRTLNYPQQLQITVDMLEAIENVRSDISTMISFDQPWGERLAWSVGGTHAMNIADTFLRHGLQVSCFGLEINLDYWPHGSLVRDPLQWVELIDLWSQFGLPILVFLSAPSGTLSEELAGKKTGIRNSMTDSQLLDYLNVIIPVLLAKPIVNGIIWRQRSDDNDLRFLQSGMKDDQGKDKSIDDLFRQIVLNSSGE